MARSFARRVFVPALVALAFGAGLTSATLLGPREAHAQLASSTIQVPPDGLVFRTRDGRAVARLSYGAQGGVFEVLNDRGDAVAALGNPPSRSNGSTWPTVVDELRDPWTRRPGPSSLRRPGSGL